MTESTMQEAVARAAHAAMFSRYLYPLPPWDELRESTREDYRAIAGAAIAAYEAEQTTPDLDEQIRGATVALADRLTECGPHREPGWGAACQCGWRSDEYTYRAHLTGLIELGLAHLKGETR